jgi:Fe-S-cluster containining protein
MSQEQSGVPEANTEIAIELRDEMVRGLVYTHNRANANTAAAHEANAALRVLVDLLVEQGLVDRNAFEARRIESSERLRREYVDRGMAVAMQDFAESKYEFKGASGIDCDTRIDLCKSACCRLPFALSKQDVREGVVKWDPGQPYMNARGSDGYCTHLDRCSGGCTIYNNRPIPCRGYDCRNDKRIWIDFENREINPRLADPDWPHCLEAADSRVQIRMNKGRSTKPAAAEKATRSIESRM